MTPRHARRAATFILGMALAGLPTASAHADPPDPSAAVSGVGALVVPPMGVDVYGANTGKFTVCGHGSSSESTVTWILTVEGTRVVSGPIAGTRTSSASSVSAPVFCIDVYKDTDTGWGTGTLTFLGAGTQVTGTFVGYFAWAPGVPDEAGGSGIT